MLDLLNFGCFVSLLYRFHCNAMRTSIKVHMNWYKIQQIEHTGGGGGLDSGQRPHLDRYLHTETPPPETETYWNAYLFDTAGTWRQRTRRKRKKLLPTAREGNVVTGVCLSTIGLMDTGSLRILLECVLVTIATYGESSESGTINHCRRVPAFTNCPPPQETY